ncbi:MAG TPA: DEAD/DEAH box helicase, partial [archaeon]|nr:DEAD/DEAH box helicase [archaeon]
MAILKNFLDGKKSVYLVPLKALAGEKYDDFSKYKKIGMRVGIATGDLDSTDGWLGSYDLVILSNEKMDSLLRHSVPWIKDISLIISDEIHVIDDASRGPTLEVVLTHLRTVTKSQIIALSATIKNADEIAQWLDAELVRSDYRPVKLSRGVMYHDGDKYKLEFESKKKDFIVSDKETDIAAAVNTTEKGKQSLVFVSTRRSAEACAERIAAETRKILSQGDRQELKKIANEIESALSSPTKQCHRLARIVEGGAAFHHAGLVAKQRKSVEDAFRSGTIKTISATPTLAFGMNLPAYRVLIRDARRFSENGSVYLSVMEIQQMMGRAGRPKYDTEGEALLLAKNSGEAKNLWERYIDGDTEPVYSKLGVESVLRVHVLSLIASGMVKTRGELRAFFSRTFFAKQYGDIDNIEGKLERITKELESYKFIIIGSNKEFISKDFVPAFQLAHDIELKPTKIGKRVSELYIDPVSANFLLTVMSEADMAIHNLMMICQCAEMRPLLTVKKKECEDMESQLASYDFDAPDVWDVEYEDFLSSFKTALLLQEWINESGEDKIMDMYGVTPGELYTKTTNAKWMLYAASELALLLGIKEIANNINKVRLQVEYGVREELLKLVALRGIGRARARKLFRAGIKTPTDVKKADETTLAKILGPKVAKEILASVES